MPALPPAWRERLYGAACLLCLGLFAWSCVDPFWVERWFEASPDEGDGSLERWLGDVALLVLAALSAWLAWRSRDARLARLPA